MLLELIWQRPANPRFAEVATATRRQQPVQQRQHKPLRTPIPERCKTSLDAPKTE